MDKRRVDNLLKEYVDTHNRDTDKDLAKLNDREPAYQSMSNNNFKKIWITGAICLVVVVISLAILLPLFLNKSNDTSSNGDTRYYDAGEIDYYIIDSIDEFNTNNNTFIKPVMSDVIDSNINVLSIKQTSEVIGIKIDLDIWRYNIDNAEIIAYIGSNRIALTKHILLPENTVFAGQTVNYRTQKYSNLYYRYYIVFELEGINYNITVTCNKEMDVAELLNKLFE